MTILLLVKAACFSPEKTSIDLIRVHTAIFTQQSTVSDFAIREAKLDDPHAFERVCKALLFKQLIRHLV